MLIEGTDILVFGCTLGLCRSISIGTCLPGSTDLNRSRHDDVLDSPTATELGRLARILPKL